MKMEFKKDVETERIVKYCITNSLKKIFQKMKQDIGKLSKSVH